MIARRTFCQLAGLALAGVTVPDDLEMRDIRLPGTFSKRMTLFLPKQPPRDAGARDAGASDAGASDAGAGGTARLLVLLHGLGETTEERAGAYAWIERYGLGTAYARLRHPPVVRTSRREDITDARLAEINVQLSAKPFGGMVIACPYLPNVHATHTPLDEVARWIVETVVPRARAESDATGHPASATEIDGCSLGGYLSLEIFLRRPEAFNACGGVQSAIGESSAARYAERFAKAMARVGPRDVYLATSSRDPFRLGNEALARELGKRSIRHTLRVLPGPHDQPWLRESGTLDMLLWHDQR
ncbi:hypothetical protein LZC95_15755 [Pendulispora brunnea]|uniref:Uncharacterized protein n=1 Tax=Pendulispora brunnea TaxID=2905690 RepID=A0ABZ2KHW4_9BACT